MQDAAAMDAGNARAAPGERGKTFLRGFLHALRETNLTGLASQVAYSLIFAMPSILLVLALVAHDIDHRTGFAISDEVRAFIIGTLPADVQPLVTTLIEDAMVKASEGPTTLTAVLSILIALFAAGNGFGELATAFDRAAAIDDPRPAWQKRFIFTASAVLIGLLLIVAFALYVWGGDLLEIAARRYDLERDWAAGWRSLQGPVIFLLVFLGAMLLYMVSCGRYSLRLTAPGALVGAVLWLLVVQGFQLYLRVAPPATAYGAASSVLVFLIFLYLSSMALIIGALVAAVIVRQDPESHGKPRRVPAILRRLVWGTSIVPDERGPVSRG